MYHIGNRAALNSSTIRLISLRWRVRALGGISGDFARLSTTREQRQQDRADG